MQFVLQLPILPPVRQSSNIPHVFASLFGCPVRCNIPCFSRALSVGCPSLSWITSTVVIPLFPRCFYMLSIYALSACVPFALPLLNRQIFPTFPPVARLLPACCPPVVRLLMVGRWGVAVSLFFLYFFFVSPLFFGNDPTANRHPIPPEYKPVKPPEMPYNTTRPKTRKCA